MELGGLVLDMKRDTSFFEKETKQEKQISLGALSYENLFTVTRHSQSTYNFNGDKIRWHRFGFMMTSVIQENFTRIEFVNGFVALLP